ncbi:MAG: hypothetical protein WCC81_20895, partial [Pseudolabrys sp.]
LCRAVIPACHINESGMSYDGDASALNQVLTGGDIARTYRCALLTQNGHALRLNDFLLASLCALEAIA